MSYRYLNVEFHRIEDLYDLRIPLDVYRTFLEALGENIIGANFNRYPGAHPRIEVRFNFETEKESVVKEIVFRIARELQERGQIRWHDRELRNWNEPDFVCKAHEIGTSCALELRNWMEQNLDVYQWFERDLRKKAGFMAQLIHLTLKHTGFAIPIVWSVLRESPTYNKNELTDEERVINLARFCATKYEERLKRVTKRLLPSFIERSTHTFFNCTYTIVDLRASTEAQVLNWLRVSSLWEHIAEVSPKVGFNI